MVEYLTGTSTRYSVQKEAEPGLDTVNPFTRACPGLLPLHAWERGLSFLRGKVFAQKVFAPKVVPARQSLRAESRPGAPKSSRRRAKVVAQARQSRRAESRPGAPVLLALELRDAQLTKKD